MRHNARVQAKEDVDEGDGFAIVRVDLEPSGVCMEAIGTGDEAVCPSCGARAWQVHDRYRRRRRPLDLPWRRWRVRLRLTVRRFCCPNLDCARRTFAESFGAGLPRYARRTAEVTAVLTTFALAAGGEAGARLAAAARAPTSPDTLLRLLRQRAQVDPAIETPRVLGVDDLALRRRHRYATLLVNLETKEPVDLLNDRTATVLAEWLRAHPGVEIIARDRAEAYAEGARAGAPDAAQVADRFHLLQNAGAAMEEVLRSRRRRVEYVEEPEAPESTWAAGAPVRPPSPSTLRRAAGRAARRARWEEVRRRRAEGQSILGIARDLGMGRKTVRRLLATPDAPRNRVLQPRPGGLTSPSLQPYVSYLQDRWQEGVRNISLLYREIEAMGFTKSRSLVAQALLDWRPPLPPGPRRRGQRRTPRTRRVKLRWLCLRPPDQLDETERAALTSVFAEDPSVKAGYDLLQRFRAVVAERDVHGAAGLATWLADAQASELAPFVAFANGIVADRVAVEAALTLPWSTGPVEGHVHRVKLLKRQHYGRAKLDLLRARVLAA